VKKTSPLAGFVKTMKAEHKAEESPSAALAKLIDDFCKTTEFDAYLAAHAVDIPNYIDDRSQERLRFRASAAGKCAQQQAFGILARGAGDTLPRKVEVDRPARQYRALYNGTFTHLRWHMLFDAMHVAGIVTTLAKEEYRANTELELDGTCDRIVSFPYLGKPFTAILDFKSIKARYFDQLIGPQEDHRLQHHGYHELKYPFKIDAWVMLYENKDDHSLKIYDQPYDELVTKRLRKNLKAIPAWLKQVADGVPSDERMKLQLTTTWCRYCEFIEACRIEHPDLDEQRKRGSQDDG